MNRKIKFRAWLPNIKKMTYEHTVEELTKGNLWNMDGETNCSIIWLQYTGLKDKNGKEIYESDIVKANDYVGIVKYGEFDIYKMIREQSDEAADLLTCTSGYGWYISFQDGTDYLFDNNTEEWLEVIGNIYENPELLEASNGERT